MACCIPKSLRDKINNRHSFLKFSGEFNNNTGLRHLQDQTVTIGSPLDYPASDHFKVTRMAVNAVSNTVSDATTVVLRRNGADTLTVTIPALTSGIFSVAGIVDYAANDVFDIAVVAGTGTGTALLSVVLTVSPVP